MPWTAEGQAWPERFGSSTARHGAISAPDISARKAAIRDGDGSPLVMVTAYDAPSARVVDAAGADMILVGDSLAMVVLGYDDTLQVTTDDMAHHVAAVARTEPATARSSATCPGSATTCRARRRCATRRRSCAPAPAR